ncbi:hypothetical protein DFH08DRAFT_810462 [Mycena albidolilacea]|uniref:Uncharacterized protein n=1 Tax=Mycena albidolilacea TaxID=1033008 RepID=A0AAD7EQ30_9AGAR|nr:hypothetical protein DFH08DRAFT_810462 [Mycena albidolilacea]
MPAPLRTISVHDIKEPALFKQCISELSKSGRGSPMPRWRLDGRLYIRTMVPNDGKHIFEVKVILKIPYSQIQHNQKLGQSDNYTEYTACPVLFVLKIPVFGALQNTSQSNKYSSYYSHPAQNLDIFPIRQFDSPSKNLRRACPPEWKCEFNGHTFKGNGWELSLQRPSW